MRVCEQFPLRKNALLGLLQPSVHAALNIFVERFLWLSQPILHSRHGRSPPMQAA